jgi:putative glutamine amidotransferase
VIGPHPYHATGEKYLLAVVANVGGIPLTIPALGAHLRQDDLLPRLDGFLLTGSESNVEPHRYGVQVCQPGMHHDAARDETTLNLIPAAVDAGIPILAICRGLQETNVAYGGTLHQRAHEIAGFHNHQENPDDPPDVQYAPSHEVQFTEDGLLQRITGVSRAMVNSLHGQAVDRLAPGLSVEGVADDGLIEAFTIDDATAFALAVQWHPEWNVRDNSVNRAVFEAFGDACRMHAKERSQ